VKIYSKLLSTGISSLSLSFVFAISKTLGPELETLSVLTLQERIEFLRSLHFNLMYQRIGGTLSNKSRIFVDPVELMMYRKGLALQCRSVFSATPIFLPHSIVVGIPIKNVDLSLILDSCKILWLSLGLDETEFDFSLRKQASKIYLANSNNIPFSEPINVYESCKILVFSEFMNSLLLNTKVSHEKDFVFFQNKTNLISLEEELGFFVRPFPKISKDFFVDNLNLKDDIIRLAVDQRKSYNVKLKEFYGSFDNFF
jgi:hypothetical protein